MANRPVPCIGCFTQSICGKRNLCTYDAARRGSDGSVDAVDCVECPYCGHERTDDLYDIREDGTEIECGACERSFTVRAYTTTTYTSFPSAEALNPNG